MKYTIVCFLFAVLLSLANASVISGNGFHPDHPGKCFISETEIFEPGNYERRKNKCCAVDCSKNGLYEMLCCGTVITAPPCWVDKSDNGKDYPDCCPRVVCPNDNES